MIINEEAARLLGFRSPAEAVGKKIEASIGTVSSSTIVGVIEDYHQQSLKKGLLPIIHYYVDDPNFFGIKVSTDNMSQTLAEIRKLWESQYAGYPFEYHFLDQLYNEQYKADQQFGETVRAFSFFILLITCMGILGLTAYNITRRTKEIGIRKVLGASVSGIVALLTRDFLRLVLLAVVIASPLAWFLMHNWLQDFAYRITIQWWMFALPGLLAVVLALLTISFQSAKAALMNPVKSLRSE